MKRRAAARRFGLRAPCTQATRAGTPSVYALHGFARALVVRVDRFPRSESADQTLRHGRRPRDRVPYKKTSILRCAHIRPRSRSRRARRAARRRRVRAESADAPRAHERRHRAHARMDRRAAATGGCRDEQPFANVRADRRVAARPSPRSRALRTTSYCWYDRAYRSRRRRFARRLTGRAAARPRSGRNGSCCRRSRSC